MNWKSIDSAPKDATAILVTHWPHHGPDKTECDCVVAAWWGESDHDGDWVCYMDLPDDPRCYFEPTHWMPLPAPPKGN